MKDEITITKADFDTAIKTMLQKNMEDPRFSEHPVGAFAYTMGGAVFAREVMMTLFEEDKVDE